MFLIGYDGFSWIDVFLSYFCFTYRNFFFELLLGSCGISSSSLLVMRNINLLIGGLDLILLKCFLEIEEEVTILSLMRSFLAPWMTSRTCRRDA